VKASIQRRSTRGPSQVSTVFENRSEKNGENKSTASSFRFKSRWFSLPNT
jgi:hypothetical protein